MFATVVRAYASKLGLTRAKHATDKPYLRIFTPSTTTNIGFLPTPSLYAQRGKMAFRKFQPELVHNHIPFILPFLINCKIYGD